MCTNTTRAGRPLQRPGAPVQWQNLAASAPLPPLNGCLPTVGPIRWWSALQAVKSVANTWEMCEMGVAKGLVWPPDAHGGTPSRGK